MAQTRDSISPVTLDSVKIHGGFWHQKQQINREVTIPVEYEQLEESHRLEILKGGWTPDAGYMPHLFWDSDAAKWLEAAAYSLQTHPDQALEKRCDAIINDLARLQEKDGYLNSYFMQVEPENRWTHLRDRHELYCAGHLMEASVAYFHATGKREFLDIMCRYADYIGAVFGPGEEQKKGYPGHEEIELALVRLADATGNAEYLELSKFFLDQRGTVPHYFDMEATERGDDPEKYRFGKYDYLQAHLPVRDQVTAEGHSVRACYLYSGMADVARKTGDKALADACRALWTNITQKRMYVHGGIGSSHHGERFTYDYDLPNEAAYAETCAAIALVFFAQRMFLLDQNGEYIDVLERALYNGVLSGVSEDGKRFFYDNFLASHPGYHKFQDRKSPHRQEWFGCACCPPNLARLISSVGSYFHVSSPSDLWINLYADYSVSDDAAGDFFTVNTRYPWDGQVSVKIDKDFSPNRTIHARIPSWCREYSVTVNGESVDTTVIDGYITLKKDWGKGDEIEVEMLMPVDRVRSHPSVRQNTGKVALQRGPLLYCLEEADNGNDLANVFLPSDADLETAFDENLLSGVVVIQAEALSLDYAEWGAELYRADEPRYQSRKLKAIPYFAWDNRTDGEMLVWLNAGS